MNIPKLTAFIGVAPDGTETGICGFNCGGPDPLPMVVAGTSGNHAQMMRDLRSVARELVRAAPGMKIHVVEFQRVPGPPSEVIGP